MRCLLLLGIVACEGGSSVTLGETDSGASDADTDADSDADSDADTDADLGPRDYAGDVACDVAIDGPDGNQEFSCEGLFSAHVDDDEVVSGTTDCNAREEGFNAIGTLGGAIDGQIYEGQWSFEFQRATLDIPVVGAVSAGRFDADASESADGLVLDCSWSGERL